MTYSEREDGPGKENDGKKKPSMMRPHAVDIA
jgi:hypothetical protein